MGRSATAIGSRAARIYDEHRIVSIRDGVIVNIAPLARTLPSAFASALEAFAVTLVPGDR
jgi:hypothetical protein